MMVNLPASNSVVELRKEHATEISENTYA